jgi:type I restriction enzyme S subunit
MPSKQAAEGDILVNSTGTGTLGRVGLWHGRPTFVDGHVTVVKPDVREYPPTVLAYVLLGMESAIERLATGSTGQTELGRERLSALPVETPAREMAVTLEPMLRAFEESAASLGRETSALIDLRDTLLPELLSGTIRVPEAVQAGAGSPGQS